MTKRLKIAWPFPRRCVPGSVKRENVRLAIDKQEILPAFHQHVAAVATYELLFAFPIFLRRANLDVIRPFAVPAEQPAAADRPPFEPDRFHAAGDRLKTNDPVAD